MHELSICQSLVEIILKELEKLKPASARLIYADVVIGAMRQIVPEYLTGAYEMVVKGTAAEGSQLRFREVPVKAKCRACSWTGDVRDLTFVCASCASPEIELTGGMELFLESLEIEN